MPVPILMYHAIHPDRSVISISPALFAWQMEWLFTNQFRVLSLEEIARSLAERRPLPDRAVAITFDDAFTSVYEHAFPLLAGYGFTATLFVVAGYAGRTNGWPNQAVGIPQWPLMTWEQIGEMADHAITIGSHTITHPWLDRLPDKDARREIVASRRMLEDRLGRAVTEFAYPYGRYSVTAQQHVSQTYSLACTTTLAPATADDDPFHLNRVDVYYLQHPSLFRQLASPFLPPYLRLRRALRRLRHTLTASA